MLDLIDLAVHQLFGPNNPAPEHLPDRLMPQADAQDWHPASESANHVTGNASFIRCARSRRDHQVAGLLGGDLVPRDLIVAMHFNRQAGRNLAKSLDEIPGE
jgi:hypothetical protein